MLLLARNCFYILEQPSNTLLHRHPRWDYFCNHVSFVFRCAFWMLLHGSLSSKRTVCFSNGEWIQHLDLGTLSAAQRISQTKIEPTRKYVRKGQQKFQGTSQLKSTGAYPPGFAHKILDSYESRGTVGCALRFKRKIDVSKTDRQIFEELDLGDLWLESKLHLAWFYIHGNKYLAIPESWRDTMESFHRELCARVRIDESDRQALNQLIAECNEL
ncbi:unnamed protein product [Durusdinium trenchii]